MSTTYSEKLNSIIESVNFDSSNPREDYLAAESNIINLVSIYFRGAEIVNNIYGIGTVNTISGTSLGELFAEVEFVDSVRKFSISQLLTNGNPFTKITNISELKPYWDEAVAVHTEITTKYKELERQAEQLKIEAEKKAEADKKAEAKYQRFREKALQDFESMTSKEQEPIENFDEFYYALGWLAKHVGTVSAAIPDYLEAAFQKYFGTEAEHTIIDAKKKTLSGYAMQWSWSFKATLRKATTIPAILNQYLGSNGKVIANTSFIWDLVDTYGFKFGKKQNVNEIRNIVPDRFKDSFDAGYND